MTSPTARPILERLAYVFYLTLLSCSIGITWLGWIMGVEMGDYRAMFVGVGGLALSRLVHVRGFSHWHFRECQQSLDTWDSTRTEHEEVLHTEITTLFAQLETESDVWSRGEVRREIAAKLAVAPGLREDFAEALAQHPEL